MVTVLMFKVQAVVLLPTWGLLMLGGAATSRRGWLHFAIAAVAMALVASLILLPFLQTPASRAALNAAIFGAVDRVPKVTMGSSNWWLLVAWPQRDASDAGPWIGRLAYKQGGLLLFFITSAVAMWPLLRHTARQLFYGEKAAFSRTRLWITAALVVINFFFWSTQSMKGIRTRR